MQAKVICMASAKGGSGKTSLAASFGSFLSQIDKKVLLIDADPATNGLTLLFIREVKTTADRIVACATVDFPRGLYVALEGGECDIVELGANLHFIPIDYSLRYQSFTMSETTLHAFTRLLRSLRGQYDFILIDAQAGVDDAAQLAISRSVSDEVIIVSEYDPMSAAGVERLKALFREDLLYDRTWVLINKILPEFVKSFGSFLEFAKYLSPIPWSAEVVRAYARRQLAIDSDTGTEHTLAVIQTLKGLCGEAIREELKAWTQSRAAIIRQPLEQQYSDAESELKELLKRKGFLHTFTDVQARILLMLTASLAGLFAFLPFLFFVFPQLTYVLPRQISATMGTLAMLVLGGLAGAVLFKGKSVERQVEEARLDRQRALLENKLERLEVLRALDAESLLQEQLSRRDREQT